ncbi:unnamed protein product [Zymoseptoria tritici ST99CH_3D1]|uniref:Uncharacterized protein n=1 Tax=Zymoseptoria tritici (strain ST99CH_3D7) TaxID=1276538 RepID=A0A1X7RM59_ZYMT9|nr:unnamed protein product [Zymoseptoria tritici ST99CH_3D7]SMR49305.1 unnamed protein product [Zymoseptoria tritici ST99CH_3D1]
MAAKNPAKLRVSSDDRANLRWQDCATPTFDWSAQLYGSNLIFSPIYFFRIYPGIERSMSSHDVNLTETTSMSEEATSTDILQRPL